MLSRGNLAAYHVYEMRFTNQNFVQFYLFTANLRSTLHKLRNVELYDDRRSGKFQLV